jgi:ADP-ribose pyrophosphatase
MRKPARGFALASSKPRLTSRVFAVHAETWTAPDGRTFERDTVVHPGAVAVLPRTADGRFLMLRQFRAAARGWLLEIPAGTLEAGETPLRCAKRELIEETGHRARRWRKLGAILPAPGFCTEIIHLYLAEDLAPAHGELDDDEHLRVVSMTEREILDAVAKGRLRDAKSLCAILHWLQGKRRVDARRRRP